MRLVKEKTFILFLVDEKPNVLTGGSAGERSGAREKFLKGATRSNSEGAVPLAGVGRGYGLAEGGTNRLDEPGRSGGAGVVRTRWRPAPITRGVRIAD